MMLSGGESSFIITASISGNNLGNMILIVASAHTSLRAFAVCVHRVGSKVKAPANILGYNPTR